MRAALFATALVLVTAVMSPAAVPLVAMVALVGCVVAGALHGADAGTPATVRRLPTTYEQRRPRRWRLGFGLALGFHGVFPFVYVTRRMRR